jgi:hypothetical protein
MRLQPSLFTVVPGGSLAAALALTLLPQVCLAGVVLSDNLSQPAHGTEVAEGTRWAASSFGTDANSYRLDSITLRIYHRGSASTTLDVYTDAGFQPGSRVASLIPPASYPVSPDEVTFGGNGISLAPNTTYWAVLTTGGDMVFWFSNFGTAGDGVGFQHSWGRSFDSGASWSTSDSLSQLMRVVATPEVPDAGPFSPLFAISAGILAYVARRARVPFQGPVK